MYYLGGVFASYLYVASACRVAGLHLTITLKLGLFNYIIDVYLFAAASALAATTVVRSLFGAIFPVSDLIFPSPLLIVHRLAFCYSNV